MPVFTLNPTIMNKIVKKIHDAISIVGVLVVAILMLAAMVAGNGPLATLLGIVLLIEIGLLGL